MAFDDDGLSENKMGLSAGTKPLLALEELCDLMLLETSDSYASIGRINDDNENIFNKTLEMFGVTATSDDLVSANAWKRCLVPSSLYSTPYLPPQTTLVPLSFVPMPLRDKCVSVIDSEVTDEDLIVVEIPISSLRQEAGSSSKKQQDQQPLKLHNPKQDYLPMGGPSKLQEYYTYGGPARNTNVNISGMVSLETSSQYTAPEALKKSRDVILSNASDIEAYQTGLLLSRPPGVSKSYIGLTPQLVYPGLFSTHSKESNRKINEHAVSQIPTSASSSLAQKDTNTYAAKGGLWDKILLAEDDDSLFGRSSSGSSGSSTASFSDGDTSQDEADDDKHKTGSPSRLKETAPNTLISSSTPPDSALFTTEKKEDADALLDSLLLDDDNYSPARRGNKKNIAAFISNENKPSSSSSWAITVELDVSDFYTRVVPNPAMTFPFELDGFQKQAVARLERNESIFVSAHTSAGKTVCAEYAIALSQKRCTRTIYTSPIKALSNQKFRDFSEKFGVDEIGLITGDVQVNPAAPCLIMTTEILRSMLYKGADLVRDIEFVVFDECHYVNDMERGVVWEEVIIMLPDYVKLVFLSATTPNAVEFCDWIGRTKRKQIFVLRTNYRPVPLTHHLYVPRNGSNNKLMHIIMEGDTESKSSGFLIKGYNDAIKAMMHGGNNKTCTKNNKYSTRGETRQKHGQSPQQQAFSSGFKQSVNQYKIDQSRANAKNSDTLTDGGHSATQQTPLPQQGSKSVSEQSVIQMQSLADGGSSGKRRILSPKKTVESFSKQSGLSNQRIGEDATLNKSIRKNNIKFPDTDSSKHHAILLQQQSFHCGSNRGGFQDHEPRKEALPYTSFARSKKASPKESKTKHRSSPPQPIFRSSSKNMAKKEQDSKEEAAFNTDSTKKRGKLCGNAESEKHQMVPTEQMQRNESEKSGLQKKNAIPAHKCIKRGIKSLPDVDSSEKHQMLPPHQIEKDLKSEDLSNEVVFSRNIPSNFKILSDDRNIRRHRKPQSQPACSGSRGETASTCNNVKNYKKSIPGRNTEKVQVSQPKPTVKYESKLPRQQPQHSLGEAVVDNTTAKKSEPARMPQSALNKMPLKSSRQTHGATGGASPNNDTAMNNKTLAGDSNRQKTHMPLAKWTVKSGPKLSAWNKQGSNGEWMAFVRFLVREELTPSVIFSFSKKKCEEIALSLRSLDLNTAAERAAVTSFTEHAIKRLSVSDATLPQVISTCEMVKRGIATHHGGLLPLLKEMVEILFSRNLIKVLFATETFAMGVNMPARSVAFNSIRKHDGLQFRELLPGEYIQMSGRAGRRGLDKVGTVIITCFGEEPPPEHILTHMLTGVSAKLQSQFRLTYNMILNLLRVEDMSVEDMIKRSFSEFATQRALATNNYPKLLARGRKILAELDDEHQFQTEESGSITGGQDIEEYFALASQLLYLNYELHSHILLSPGGGGGGALAIGRVVLVTSARRHGYVAAPGIVLRPPFPCSPSAFKFPSQLLSSTTRESSSSLGKLNQHAGFSPAVCLVLLPFDFRMNDEKNVEGSKSLVFSSEIGTLNYVGFDSSGRHYAIHEVELTEIFLVSSTKLSINSKAIFKDLPASQGDSADSSLATANVSNRHVKKTKGATLNKVGLFDPSQYHRHVDTIITLLTDFEAMESSSSVSPLSSSIDALDLRTITPGVQQGEDYLLYRASCDRMEELLRQCRSCQSYTHPNVCFYYEKAERKQLLRARVSQLEEFFSNESLALFPDFMKRKAVLQALGYVDDTTEAVCLKGRIACEVNSCESLIATELILDGILNELEPAEIVAVLSALVAKEKTSDEEETQLSELPRNLIRCCNRIKSIAYDFGALQKNHGLLVDPVDYVDEVLKFGLVQVVYEWALGVPFCNICELTMIQEGSIVRCITRLDELCREVRNCARVAGNPTLYQKMEAASAAIKRDIVFASSLYVY